ncbi:MAG: AtpZ/AtpI family protein [Desulfurivibrionaceae bacterium]
MSSNHKETLRLLAQFSTVGMSVAFSIFIGVGVGYFLDHRVFGGRTSPWLTLIFLGFGVAAAFKNLYHMASRKDL